ncbi:uncharacterized protein MYCFIDRAFT_204406 [Pseudocercospora fijiensis CIRAD86]|uniref:Uncharacterized protein n=1 Tax=Pseudocercospora fijiensis (strain CIRAD86) TaxID=383855 RepID=M3A5T2_PSEFD|nr:uncharacterized protein MYCFIDRAFT_204406 [Pseudocercospora fijiensis CIRAD86]EME79986.1 hypothetical protein MYCFIDRAFT_204406 [Pseudocercospora fijiensis CIRAD86]
MIALLRKLIRDHRIEQRGEGNPIPDMLQTAWAIRAIKRTHEIALRNGNAQDADWLADTFGENVQFWSLSSGGIAASGKLPRSKT